MNGNVFFTSESLTTERLSWLVELLKFYSTRLYPESFHHHPRTPTPLFTFFLLSDACYSFIDRRHLQFWEILFRLPCFQCIFEPKDLHMRRISIEPFRVRYPDQIIPSNPGKDTIGRSIWDCLLDLEGTRTELSSIGFLHMHSPYMYHADSCVIDLFRTALRRGISPEFYGYLDGVHTMHRDQKPIHHENIGESLLEVYTSAVKSGLSPLYLLCPESAASRGYSTYTGEKGKVVSVSLIPHAGIRSLDQIVSRFTRSHPILSHTSFSIDVVTHRKIPRVGPPLQDKKPSLVILATHSPYGTEFTKGAITFAVACAHQGIATRVVFIEEGVYTLTGQDSPAGMLPDCDLQSIIEITSRMDNLEYFVYTPSSQERGIAGNALMKGVCPIPPHKLGQVLLLPPPGVDVDQQRVLVF